MVIGYSMNNFSGGNCSGETSLQDLAWSGSETNYVVAVYSNGDIVLYDLKATTLQVSVVDGTSNVAVPTVLQKVNQGSLVSRCLFLPHYEALSYNDATKSQPRPYTSCFLTGANGDNAFLTLWSAFTCREKVKWRLCQSSDELRCCCGKKYEFITRWSILAT
jgi:hypothetical protein